MEKAGSSKVERERNMEVKMIPKCLWDSMSPKEQNVFIRDYLRIGGAVGIIGLIALLFILF